MTKYSKRSRLPFGLLVLSCLGALVPLLSGRIKESQAFSAASLTTDHARDRGLAKERTSPRVEPNATMPEPTVGLASMTKVGATYVATLPDGRTARLTVDPALQAKTDAALTELDSPYAAAVLLSVTDGRVLAISGHSRAEPQKSNASLALSAWAPAASVFKLVTTAALLERGVSSQTQVCYHDGFHSVESSNLVYNKKLDGACASLAYGLAKSQNAILARLANDHLSPSRLADMAHRLGFGAPLNLGSAMALPLEASAAEIPAQSGLDFARVAAGFWSTSLSALHGAMLAAIFANRGELPPVHIIDGILHGTELRPVAVGQAQRVLSQSVAQNVATMMLGTTQFGTAHGAFFDKKSGAAFISGVDVAGKTGTLNRNEPFLGYSLFVGFAPANHPQVAVAVVLGNGVAWRKKASTLAAQLLGNYFTEARRNLRLAAR